MPAVELLAATRAPDLRGGPAVPPRLAAGRLAAVRKAVRERVPFLRRDAALSGVRAACGDMILGGELFDGGDADVVLGGDGMTPAVSHSGSVAGNGRAEPMSRFRDWTDRFLALADRLPASEPARHHGVWALMQEGSDLVASAQDAGVPGPEIRAAVAAVRELQRASPFVCRLQDWPRGCPGDFETVEYLCRQENRAAPGTVGWYVEGVVLNAMITQQHCNKVARQAELIADAVARNADARILAVACGGAPDVRRVLPAVARSRCRLVLNDMDPAALAFCRDHLAPLGDRAGHVGGNALRVAPRVSGSGPFDLILCGGLFDYLDGRQAAFLVEQLTGLLREGPEPGRLFLTNIGAGNPYRPWMEFFVDWRLTGRTPADLYALAAPVGPGRFGVTVAPDPTGLTWLVEITRRTNPRTPEEDSGVTQVQSSESNGVGGQPLPPGGQGCGMDEGGEIPGRPGPAAPRKGDHDYFVRHLSPVPSEDDQALHRRNSSPDLVTRRLRELVPLLEVAGCVVREVGPERTVLELPLLQSAMNQNGTHQAAVFYLVADYTLGVGMFGVLPGCYVTGVHDRCGALPVQFWLKRGSVEHLAPGTGTLTAEVRIPPGDAEQLRRRIVAKGRGEYTGTVRFYQEGRPVAEATHTMGVYADLPREAGARANMFQVQNLKLSALMISGLREDPVSKAVAGDQGRAVAGRMALASPQLPSLVRARTLDLERLLEGRGGAFAQVLVLGVGFDPKPVRFSGPAQRWYGLDLRQMHAEREARFTAAGARAQDFVPVAGDILSEDWDAAVRDAGFRPDLPALVIAEGLSMYFPREVLAAVFHKLRGLTASPASRFWLDHVTPALFDLDAFEVRSFLASMARLGEPFVTGLDDPAAVEAGTWALCGTTTAASAVGVSDPVHDAYRFSVLRPV